MRRARRNDTGRNHDSLWSIDHLARAYSAPKDGDGDDDG